jgi:hypothetical protein
MGRKSEPRTALPKRAEKLLREFPESSRSEADWARQSDAILARLQTAQRDASADELLEPPLPQQPNEPLGVPLARTASSRRTFTWVLTGTISVAAAALFVLRLRGTQPENAARSDVPTSERAPAAVVPAEPAPAELETTGPPTPPSKIQQPPETSERKALAPAPTPRPAGRALAQRVPLKPTAEEKKPEVDQLEPDPKLRPADGREPVADRPSQGAVAAALAPVQGDARACLRGQTQSAGVEIEFGSDGRVKSVTIREASLPEATERCIQAALTRARVGPFARPSWLVRHRVRPP